MAIEYPSLKVPDLKKLLQERGLIVSGNKAELISRLQEDDKKSSNGPAAGEDEIDWEEDDKTVAVASVSVASTTIQPAPEQSQITEIEVTITDDSGLTSIIEPQTVEESKTTEEAEKMPSVGNNDSAAETDKPTYKIGLDQSDAVKEAEKRAARAKRFGIPQNEEAEKLAERARKFGLTNKDEVVQSLDTALPDHKLKRMRDQRSSSRPDKRQASSHRKSNVNSRDAIEKAKAAARAKRFARPIGA